MNLLGSETTLSFFFLLELCNGVVAWVLGHVALAVVGDDWLEIFVVFDDTTERRKSFIAHHFLRLIEQLPQAKISDARLASSARKQPKQICFVLFCFDLF